MNNENNNEVIDSLMDEPLKPSEPTTKIPTLEVENLDITITDPNAQKPKENEEKKPKKKIGKIIIAVIVLLIVGFVIYLAYGYFMVSPKNIYNKVFDASFMSVNNKISSLNNLEDSYGKGNIVFNTNDENYKLIKDYSIDYSYVYENDKYQFSLNLNEDNKNIFDLLFLNESNQSYLKANKLYDKVINLGNYSLNNENIDLVKEDMQKIKDYLKSYLDNMDYHKKIAIKDISFINEIVLNGEDLENIITGLSNLELKTLNIFDSINLILLNSENNDAQKILVNLKIDIYTNVLTNDFNKLEIYLENNKVMEYQKDGNNFNFILGYDKNELKVDGNANNYKLNLISDGKVLANLNYQKNTSGEVYDINYLDYNLNITSTKESAIFKLSNKTNEYNMIVNKNAENVSYKSENLSNVINLENLTENDYEKISNNVQRIILNTKAYKKLLEGAYGEELKSSLGIYGLNMVNMAKESLNDLDSVNPKDGICFDLTYLVNNGYIENNGYKGSVLVSYSNVTNNYNYYFWITDQNFNYSGVNAISYSESLANIGSGISTINACGNSLSAKYLCSSQGCVKK